MTVIVVGCAGLAVPGPAVQSEDPFYNQKAPPLNFGLRLQVQASGLEPTTHCSKPRALTTGLCTTHEMMNVIPV